jgi:hypothetical protein
MLQLFAQLDRTDSLGKVNASVLGLIGDLLTNNTTNQEEMLRSKGFSLITFILQGVHPSNITLDLLSLLKDVASKITLEGN